MVYGRQIRGQELNFEASGALLHATLVMRDRETDSWWSIMSSDAIGGELAGADLPELPVSHKMRWNEWVARHPKTVMLSIDGVEHVENNPYDNYFASDETFRGLQIDDDRLRPKTPVYVFWHGGTPFAIPHAAFEGGAVIPLPESDLAVHLYRPSGSSVFASSIALVGPAAGPDVLDAIRDGEQPRNLRSANGFDTYWYSWISVNPDSRILP